MYSLLKLIVIEDIEILKRNRKLGENCEGFLSSMAFFKPMCVITRMATYVWIR